MSTIGDRIKEIRRIKKYTQQRLAYELGLKQNTIATYEMNKTTPSDRTIIDICRKFNIREEWLRTGQMPMEQSLSRQEEITKFVTETMADASKTDTRRILMALMDASPEEIAAIARFARRIADEADTASKSESPSVFTPLLYTEHSRNYLASSPKMVPGTDGPVEIDFPSASEENNT